MTRLKKEMVKRGLIFDTDCCDEYITQHRLESQEQNVSFWTKDFIVCFWCSNVVNPEWRIYDKNFNFIGGQNVQPDNNFFGMFDKWESFVN